MCIRDRVVVLYKDRLLSFGFELIEYIASLYNCEIEIIDNTEKSEPVSYTHLDVYKRQIQTGEPVAMALRKCPNLVIVPSDFELYDKCSLSLIHI